MDLRSTLKSGDLFISYWIDKDIMVMVGDNQGIIAVDILQLNNLVTLIDDFEKLVTNSDQYVSFIAERFRSADWPVPGHANTSMSSLLMSLGRLVVSKTIEGCITSRKYNRLIIFPDGLLHAIPIHVLFEVLIGDIRKIFHKGILYAPSGSSYIYASTKRRVSSPRRGLILIGDDSDPELISEGENVAKRINCPVDIITQWDDFEKAAPAADILYIATHGELFSEGSTKNNGASDKLEWHLLFDNSSISTSHFYQERIKLQKGSLVIVSACSVGHIHIGQAHEIDGLVQALFYAGASTVLSARWPIIYEAAEAVFAGTIKRVYGSNISIGAAMIDAIDAASKNGEILKYMSGPEALPFFLGPFTLYGCGD